MITGFGKYIACEPFKVEEDQDKSKVKVGKMEYKIVSQRTTLIGLRVVYGSVADQIEAGDLVYVTQAGTNQVGMVSNWTKSVDVELDDGGSRAVVLVAIDDIRLVDRKRPLPQPESGPKIPPLGPLTFARS